MKAKSIALTTLLLCCFVVHAKQTDEPRIYPFFISNVNTGFATQGDFEGEYQVYPDRVALHFTKAVITISENCPYKGRRLLTSLKFGFATPTEDNRWKPVNLIGTPLYRIMVPRDTYDLGELYFSLPFDASMDLSSHWLVAQIGETSLDSTETPNDGYSIARSRRDIFARPLLANVREPQQNCPPGSPK
jgi:hypothetical protein